tara:strand:+ start:37341 stop:38393 length:1053 start_codon:yes stop_codon:yes gene_type:complete
MSNLNSTILHNKIYRPLLFNSVLWGISYVVLLFVFIKGEAPVKIDVVYTLGFLVTLSLPALINLYILIPKFLEREKYIYYALAVILNLTLFIQLNHWCFAPVLDWFFPNFFFISYTTKAGVNTIFILFLVATTLLKLSENWFYFNREENRRLQLANQHIQMQLTSLRSQINPHFLFNSLNVIYALAIEKREETKDAIVQLSDILRYVIYDSNTQNISIKDEVILLKNYIDFHKFRFHNFKNIIVNSSIENENYPLYPMLLLPLIENSFKHSTIDDSGNAFITIDITQKENTFFFTIENNNTKKEEILPNEYSGIGLENIKNNLELVYPGRYTFTIKETKELFSVNLTLQI